MKVPYLVFDLGSLRVYTMQPPSIPGEGSAWTPHMITDNYWWTDPASPQGYGPFVHITACIEHYTWYIATAQGKRADLKLLDKPVAQVIRVDFRNKSKVITNI